MKIAVIGGGITGLSAAYYMQKEILTEQLDAHVELFEANEELGGKIRTHKEQGYLIERGPDSFLARKPGVFKLAKEVGMDEEIVPNDAKGASILSKGRMHSMPGGAVMGIPTKFAPFAASSLFSPAAKARAAMDLMLPRGGQTADESVGGFFRRRLGHAVVDQLIEPLLSGIYAGDIDHLSLEATFPQFRRMEEEDRSLIKGMKKSQAASKEKQEGPSAEQAMFRSFKYGLSSLVDAIHRHLDEDAVRLGCTLSEISRESDGLRLTFADGTTDWFDRVLLTVPHHLIPEMIPSFSGNERLSEAPATTVATVAMGFDQTQLDDITLEGTGFLVADKANYDITACTFTHRKWSHTAPEGKGLLRTYVGRPGQEDIVSESDETIVERAVNDLKRIMPLKGEPEFSVVTRWRNSMPQYLVGHKDKVQAIETHLEEEFPGLYVTGASFGGIGLPDCVTQGEKAAYNLLSLVQGQS
ncbi:oxygen-dependent protoporphyrinogen oxidase [Salsuginibacillus halophilus]|uniref:Coproporphyrinogen III oxidase n=1 Tax=Salsuginibacillus halophilus TaxID=517424 RepID=A0A2P8HFZ5_9BACI|nr:protoporphyrinogen oxidase [Salsuginibacillus halophilus]PSL45141.1 oxygen-dependent protoporphyrinogen oxidase [Salsuginibacillus halophilus]